MTQRTDSAHTLYPFYAASGYDPTEYSIGATPRRIILLSDRPIAPVSELPITLSQSDKAPRRGSFRQLSQARAKESKLAPKN